MSTLFRLAKGTGLSLVRIFVSIAGQIVTVPIYLDHWHASKYGVWLILQGLFGYLTLASVAFQQYIFAEVLKRGPGQFDEVRRIYWAALAVGYVIAGIEFAAVLGFAPHVVRAALPADAGVPPETVVALLVLFSLVQLLLMPFGANTANTMTIHGFYPRSVAWSLFNLIATLFAPLAAVLLGADLLITGFSLIGAHAVSGLLMIIDYAHLARRYKMLSRSTVDWREGFSAALYSLPLAARSFIDSFRQQGFRILLGAFVGVSAVTELATTRTFANLLHQGLSTITAPLLPELMRYVVNRDQDRTEGAFAVVWLFLFVLLVPGMLFMCLMAGPLFLYWTRGEVPFDPVLFLTLLVGVLVFAAFQPATAILQGRNRINWMVSATVSAAGGLLLFALVLLPPFGLRGAGFALLGGEITAAGITVAGAVGTMRSLGLAFPLRSFALVICNVAAVFTLTLFAITYLHSYPWAMALPFAANVCFLGSYWVNVPRMARAQIRAGLGMLQTRVSSLIG